MHINIHSDASKFIDSLEPSTYSKALRVIDLLESFGFSLGMPHSKRVSKVLFELRIKGQQEARIFYCFYLNEIHLLSGFIKKEQKIPYRELLRAGNKYKALTS